MRMEVSRQHHIPWIPWILALVALLGVDAISKETSYGKLSDANDGVGLSADARVFGSVGRASDPLVLGPPAPPFDLAMHVSAGMLLKLAPGEEWVPHSLRRGSVWGRAPPFGT
jgi:hypothetical protein